MKNQIFHIILLYALIVINISAMEVPKQNSSEESSEVSEENKNVSDSVLVATMRGVKVCADETYAIIVERLVMQRANVNWQSQNGYTALHYAIENPYVGLKTINALCENRADLTIREKAFERTPLDLACELGEVAKIKALLNIAEDQSE